MLTRVVQIMWMVIAAVCTYEAYSSFTDDPTRHESGVIAIVVGVIALTRYILLRRSQLKRDGKL